MSGDKLGPDVVKEKFGVPPRVASSHLALRGRRGAPGAAGGGGVAEVGQKCQASTIGGPEDRMHKLDEQ